MPTIDLGLIISGTNRATSGIKSAGSDLDDLDKHVKRVGESSQETANRLKAIEVVIGGILIEKSIELTKAFVEMASKVQNVEIRMAAWAGGIENSEKIISTFVDKIGAAGINMDVLGNSFVKLRAAGVGADEAQKTIINLVNGIAAVGGDNLAGNLEAAATSFQRFAAKGVVSTRELNAIVHSTGLTVGELAKSAELSITQFYDKLKDKTLGASVLLDAFNKAAHEKFGDFASLLNNTIGGSISKFKVDLDEAFGHLGGAGINVSLVAFIQNLDKAVTNFISHISAQDVAIFFNLFRDAAPTISAVGNLILFVGKALVIALDAAFRFANLLPGEAVEFGILGYVLMGKKGALLLGLIATLTGQVKTLAGQVTSIASSYDKVAASGRGYQGVLDALNKSNPGHEIANMFSALTGATLSSAHAITEKLSPSLAKLAGDAKSAFGEFGKGDGKDFIGSLFGTPEQLKAIQAGLDQLAKVKVGSTGLTEPPDNTALEGKLATLREETANLLKSTAGKDALLKMQTAGDELGQKLQQINNQTAGWNEQLNLAAVKIAASKLPLSEKVAFEKQLSDLQRQINTDTDAALAQAQALNTLKQAQLSIQEQIAQAQNDEATRQLQVQLRQQNSPRFNALSSTSGGTLALQVDAQRVQYAQKLLEYQAQIDGLEVKAANDTANANKYRATEASIQRLMDMTKQFADQLRADTQLQTQFFKELATTMENDVASGLSGLIQGTMTWGDVGRKVFGDMIDMAIKYLIQLAEIKLFTMALGMFSDGGVIPTGVQPFANGGVPGITPFANGGLTQGPTLFGLAGEAGTEAIMPLTRIGGKLGVHASGGGGGNNYHITVNAVDTQTGMQFVAKHIGSIDAGLRQRQNLNRKG